MTYPSSVGPVVLPPRDGHRRRFTEAGKHRILGEAAQTCASLAQIARRHGIARRVLCRRKQELALPTMGYQIGASMIAQQDAEAGLISLGKDWEMDDVIVGSDCWSNCYDGWTEELRYLLCRYDEHLAAEAGEKFNTSEWNKI